MNRLLFTILCALAALWTGLVHAASPYEESLMHLADGVVADAPPTAVDAVPPPSN